MKLKGKSVKGKDYAAAEELFNKRKSIKEDKSMSTAGLANALKKSKKEMFKAKLVKVKPKKK